VSPLDLRSRLHTAWVRLRDIPPRLAMWAIGAAVLTATAAFALGVEAYVRWGRL
jgi:hypothetical protein